MEEYKPRVQAPLTLAHHPVHRTPLYQPENFDLCVPTTPLANGLESGLDGRGKIEYMDSIDGSDINSNSLESAESRIPAVKIPQIVNRTLPVPTVENVVGTFSVGTRLDLKKIAMHTRNAEYNPKRFAAVVMRIREPRSTALIFNSGKIVVTGAKSESYAKLAARKFARILQKLEFPVKFQEFKIQNLVGAVDLRFAIQLEGLNIAHSQFSTYEPELFPGLIYRMVQPRVVMLIFVTGKVVITGAKLRHDMEEAFKSIYPILLGFRK